MTPRGFVAVLLCGLSLGLHLTLPPGASAESAPPATGLIDRYHQAIAADPDNLTLHYLLGVALLTDHQDQAALAAFRRAYPAYRTSLEANYNLGVASVRLGDIDSALIYLDQAEALGAAAQPEVFPLTNLYFNLALLAQEGGQENETIRLFRKVLELDPQRYEVYRQLGDLHAHRGETDLAVRAFQTYLEQFPSDAVSRDYLFALEFNRAQDLLAGEDLEQAEHQFEAALAIYPESPVSLYYLGYIAYRQDQPAKALPLLRQAYASDDASLRASIRPLLYNSSLALRQAGLPGEALAAAELLAEQNDANFNELFLAGTLYLKQGRHRQARSFLLRATRLDPDHAGAIQNLIAAENGAYDEWLSLARQQLTVGDYPATAAALAEAAALRADDRQLQTLRTRLDLARRADADRRFAVAHQALQEKDFDAAQAAIRQGLEWAPESPQGRQLRDQFAAAFATELHSQRQQAANALADGRWREAEQALRAILALDPDDTEATAELQQVAQGRQAAIAQQLAAGQAALDRGELELARTAFRQALQEEPGLASAATGLATADELLANRLTEYLQQGRRAMNRARFTEAREWFDKARQLVPGEAADTALADLQQAVSTRADALSEKAGSLAEQGDLKRADSLYAQALKLVPDHVGALAGRQALEELTRQALSRQLAEAAAAMQQSDYAAAMGIYRKALDLAPEDPTARDGVRRVRAAQADASNTLAAEAEALFQAGDLAAAAARIKRLLALDPYHAGALQLQERLDQLRLSGARPGDEQKLYLQGLAEYTQGRYHEAIKAWETVLTLDPGHVKARQNIEKTRRKLRQLEEYRSG